MKNLKINLVDKTCKIQIIEQEGTMARDWKLPVDCWSLEDYKRQWEEGLDRIKNHDNSCLVVWASKLDKIPNIYYYALYKINDKIHIQEMCISNKKNYKDLSKKYGPFTLENCYKYIPEYMSEHEGDKFFEYIIDLE